jgi:hypothetical protein
MRLKHKGHKVIREKHQDMVRRDLAIGSESAEKYLKHISNLRSAIWSKSIRIETTHDIQFDIGNSWLSLRTIS